MGRSRCYCQPPTISPGALVDIQKRSSQQFSRLASRLAGRTIAREAVIVVDQEYHSALNSLKSLISVGCQVGSDTPRDTPFWGLPKDVGSFPWI